MHDIGKIGIHEDIIHKNSRLSEDEFASVKEHTVKGYDILKEIKDMPVLCRVARWHHERYDGSEYPDGLKGEEIPEYARISCVADCYDAMTSTRTYSVPGRKEDVRAEILRCRGSWFDPKIADVMLLMIDEDTEVKMNESAKGADVWKEYDRLWENEPLAVIGSDRNDTAFIADNTGSLLEMYRKLDEDLSAMERDNKELPMITPSQMKEAYQTMAEIAPSMDYGMMYDLLKEVRQYRLESGDDKRIRMIEELLTKLEWEEIEKEAKNNI